jgi:hypothetical protein
MQDKGWEERAKPLLANAKACTTTAYPRRNEHGNLRGRGISLLVSIPSTFLRNTFLPGFHDHRPSKEKPRIEGSKNLNATTQPRRNPRMFAVYVYQFGEEGQVFFGLVLAVCVTEDFRKPALDVSKLSAPRLPPCQQPYGVPRYWEVCSPSCKESIVHPAKNLTLRGLLMNKKAPG